MKLINAKFTTSELLLATIADAVRGVIYGLSNGKADKPASIVAAMTSEPRKKNQYQVYDTPEAFMAERSRILGAINGNNS